MKTTSFIVGLLLSCVVLGLRAQDARSVPAARPAVVEAARPAVTQSELQRTIPGGTTGVVLTMPARPRPESARFQDQVTYGGFLVDMAKSSNWLRTLSLRQPVDLKRDAMNLSYDPMTGKIVGFKLLSIDF